jgi:hypothetical protein
MNKTGMTRTPTTFAPKPKTNAVELFVLHSLPDRKKETFSTYKEAFAAFKQRTKQRGGSFALWRGPDWTKLYSNDTYPPALKEPYLNADV